MGLRLSTGIHVVHDYFILTDVLDKVDTYCLLSLQTQSRAGGDIHTQPYRP